MAGFAVSRYPDPMYQKGSNTGRIVAIVVVLLLIVAGIIVFIATRDRDAEPTESAPEGASDQREEAEPPAAAEKAPAARSEEPEPVAEAQPAAEQPRQEPETASQNGVTTRNGGRSEEVLQTTEK